MPSVPDFLVQHALAVPLTKAMPYTPINAINIKAEEQTIIAQVLHQKFSEVRHNKIIRISKTSSMSSTM